jgi:glycosyltransferase involved in cell wall biosynthesis
MLEPWARQHKQVKKTIAWRLYQRRDIASASRLHATSATEAANLKLLGIDVPVSVIPNGVDVPDLPESNWENSTPTRTALFIGRLYPVKGLPMLIDAWSRTRPAGWKLIIAGPDEAGHRDFLEKKITVARLQEDISFAGPVSGDAKTAMYQKSEIFVLPTHSESFGVAIAEALAHGVPVLTTTSAPWPDLESRDCGWLADPTVESLSGKLLEATKLPAATLSKMGSHGRAYVASGFSWQRVATKFSQLYESLISAA